MYHPTPDSLSYACYQALERHSAIGANLTYRDQEQDMMLFEAFYIEFTIQPSTKQLTTLYVLHFLRPKDIP